MVWSKLWNEQARASLQTTMTVSFHRFLPDKPLSAFHDGRIRMSFGSPIVECLITVRELQGFITTLEQAIQDEPNFIQQHALSHIKNVLQGAYQLHMQQHEELCNEAPIGADFEEYLLNYSRAIKGES